MPESRFAGVVSAHKIRFSEEGGVDVTNRLAICALLESSVNTNVFVNCSQSESIFDAIKMIARHGDGSDSGVRMQVFVLSTFINTCRG